MKKFILSVVICLAFTTTVYASYSYQNPFYGNYRPQPQYNYATTYSTYGMYGNRPPMYGNRPPMYGNAYGNMYGNGFPPPPPKGAYGNMYGNRPPMYGSRPPMYGNTYGNRPPMYGSRPPMYGNGNPPPPPRGGNMYR